MTQTNSVHAPIVPIELEAFFKALASETRRKIVFQVFMDGQERTVNEVAEAADLGQSTASAHLAILRRAGIVRSRRAGNIVFSQPDRDTILAHLKGVNDLLTRFCAVE